MIFLHQVVSGSEGDQVSIVSWSRDGYTSSAANVSVAELVGENLQLVSIEAIVIPQHMIVRRTTCTLQTRTVSHYSHPQVLYSHLNTSVTAQVEVKLGGVSDPHVDGGTCRDVTTLTNLVLLVCTE